LPSALIVLSRNGQIEYCNQAAGELAATPHDRLPGQALATHFPPLALHLDNIEKVANAQAPIELHRQHWTTSGSQRIVNIALYPLASRTAGGVVIRIDDVTDRTRLEEVMIQSEKLVSIGGLAAGIAHEINNPLGVMVQAAQNIERRFSDTIEANHRVAGELGIDMAIIRAYLEKRNILEFLDDIKSDGARAAKIVRSLLEFSRKSEPVLEATALPELLEHTVELARKDYDLKKRFDFRRIDVRIDLPDEIPPLSMIRSEIEQVLLNLLKNSAQAMEEKFSDPACTEKPRILIRVLTLPEFVEIEISDNGPGFSEEAKRRAFEPFFTTKAPGIGTGLGLWISYMIITDKHHGQMLLESTQGEGATFILRLPK
jgi:PAS domain S-box-containing protein